MVNNKKPNSDIFSANDPLDINELAALNDDISPEFIEQLQSQLEQNANSFITGNSTDDDIAIFEEVPAVNTEEPTTANIASTEDEFMKKFNAKKNKQLGLTEKEETIVAEEIPAVAEEIPQPIEEPVAVAQIQIPQEVSVVSAPIDIESQKEIESLTGGNIVERPITTDQMDYNNSLDFLDNNVKYKKYVIYVDPQNTEFIESLTVKERKNLINRILREQDDIAITKRRLGTMQAVIKHAIVAIITISIAIPAVYWIINASLEASINNYRRSQSIFQTLYKEKGKIQYLKKD